VAATSDWPVALGLVVDTSHVVGTAGWGVHFRGKMTHVATLKFQGRERKSRLKFCIMLQHAHLLEIQKLQLSQKNLDHWIVKVLIFMSKML